MKNYILIIIILIITGFQLSAQRMKDVLYLKNGSKIYGKLIEAGSDQYKLQTSDGSIMSYESADVDKFTRETPVFDGRKTQGFSFSIETGLLVGPQNANYSAPFSFNFLAGNITKTNSTISAGSGVEFIGRPYTPLFGEFRYVLYNRKTSPYVFIRTGGLIALGGDETSSSDYDNNDYNIPKNYKGGSSFTFGSGISWAMEDYEIYLSFAYRNAHTSYQQKEYNRGDVTYKNNLNRLELKIGCKF